MEEHFVQCWASQYRRNMDVLESVEQRATKMITGPEQHSYKERMRAGLLVSCFKASRREGLGIT